MKIRPEQLQSHLQRTLAPIYLVTGDELLQRQECVDAIRFSGQTKGFADRVIFDGENAIDWNRFSMAARERSLFGDQRILDLRLSQKPDREGQTRLIHVSSELSEDILLIIQLPKLTAKEQQAAWFQKLEAKGICIQVWPLEGDRLIRWLDQRMNNRGLLADQSGLRLLAARVEGNLLAAAQEIEKLHILYGTGQVTDAMILASVADNARFDVFDLAEEILRGRLPRIQRILTGLKNEGIAPQVALWSITRELRLANRIRRDMAQGKNFETLANTHRLWDRHKSAMQMALDRLTLPLIQDALLRSATIDRIGKGLAPGDPWDALWTLCVLIATGNSPTKPLATH